VTLFTIGYQGSNVKGYIDALEEHNVEVLIDVREVPWSRKKGFSKASLASSLNQRGIEYIHLKSAGNPGYLRKSSSNIQECLAKYRDYVDENPVGIVDLMNELSKYSKEKKNVCITCFERDPEECHRSIITEKLLDHYPRAKVVHLNAV
jgi:uncharacterized protein (DUF488 family)